MQTLNVVCLEWILRCPKYIIYLLKHTPNTRCLLSMLDVSLLFNETLESLSDYLWWLFDCGVGLKCRENSGFYMVPLWLIYDHRFRVFIVIYYSYSFQWKCAFSIQRSYLSKSKVIFDSFLSQRWKALPTKALSSWRGGREWFTFWIVLQVI